MTEEEKKGKEQSEAKEEKNEDTLAEMFAEPIIVKLGQKELRVQPAPFGDLNRVTNLLAKIDDADNKNAKTLSPQTIDGMVAFIHDAISYHHDYSKNFIKKYFPLTSFPDFVDARIQSGTFFVKMRKLRENIPQV